MWSALGNETINRTARWEPEPNVRGTYSILSTCLVTLSLSVWTALHLNVPEHGKTRNKKWWQLVWLTVGLLCPEYVAISAYRQWMEQRYLTQAIVQEFGELNPLPAAETSWTTKVLRALRLKKKADVEQARVQTGLHDRRRYPWTATHSFLISMGGLTFDNSRVRKTLPLPEGRQRVTLTARGVLRLAQMAPRMVPDLSAEEIRDKSKANAVAKMLAFVQALWFCTQVLTRLGEHLAVTLLELNTFAHALCAMAIYLIWWDKPLDIEEPFAIEVEGDEQVALCAAFCMNQPISCRFPCWLDDERSRKPYRQTGIIRAYGHLALKLEDFGKPLSVGPELPSDVAEPGEPGEPGELGEQTQDSMGSTQRGEQNDSVDVATQTGQGSDAKAVSEPDEQSKQSKDAQGITGHAATMRYKQQHGPVQFDHIRFWTPYGRFFNTVLGLFTMRHRRKDRISIDVGEDFFVRAQLAQSAAAQPMDMTLADDDDALICDRAPNWVFGFEPRNSKDQVLYNMALLMLSSVAYGGWHLTAWNGPFHDHTELVLWRGSGTGLGAGSVALLLLVIVLEYVEDAVGEDKVWEIAAIPLAVVICLLPLFLLACRFCLVVESFVGLAYVPDSAFLLPSWPSYFPHIS